MEETSLEVNMDSVTILHGLKEMAQKIQELEKWFEYQENRINELEEELNNIAQDYMLSERLYKLRK
jgi:predicted RNase H-like nuclease (RuvC/YqgF family)